MRDEDEDEYARPDYEGGEDRGLAAREYQEGPRNREERLNIVDGDMGQIYMEWERAEYNVDKMPFSGTRTAASGWNEKYGFIEHPDAEKLSQKHGYDAWWVRNVSAEEAADRRAKQRSEPLVGKYNLPSTGWGIPEPDRGTTSEGTSIDEMPASWKQILRDVI